ncbi:MAG: hypothetical protein AB7V42_00370 [Thermoleophilia bacterium]
MTARRGASRRVIAATLGALVALGIALALAFTGGDRADAARNHSKSPAPKGVPTFTLDARWPAALPNDWVFGQGDSVAVDRHDHVWVLTRPAGVPAAELEAGKIAAPPVVELDRTGRFVRGWGGPDWVKPWFASQSPLPDYPIGTPAEHGIYVDGDDNVWLTGSGHVVLKFTRSGRLLLQIGEFGQTGGSNDTRLLGNPTDIAVDTTRNEVYVSDGYLNRRVIVFDSETGAYKRHWGAYGNVPNDDPPELYEPGKPLPRQFFIVHGIQLSDDGLLYVSDRQRNRIQVFRPDGTFVREGLVDPTAPAGGGITEKGVFTDPRVAGAGYGSVARVAFSSDRAQRYLYAATVRGQIFILRRSDLKVLGSFTAQGGLHHIASDSRGDIIISDGRTPLRYRMDGSIPAGKS